MRRVSSEPQREKVDIERFEMVDVPEPGLNDLSPNEVAEKITDRPAAETGRTHNATSVLRLELKDEYRSRRVGI